MPCVANLINENKDKNVLSPLNAIPPIKPLASFWKCLYKSIVYKVEVYICSPNDRNVSSIDKKKYL